MSTVSHLACSKCRQNSHDYCTGTVRAAHGFPPSPCKCRICRLRNAAKKPNEKLVLSENSK